MSLLVLAVVLIGFARTYFLAGMLRAPLPNRLIHVHGAVFTSWVLLVIVQTALIRARKVRIHRTLGMLGFGLAVAMVGLGVAAATDALRRGFVPSGAPFNAATFYIVPITSMVLFSVLIFFAWRMRYQASVHKRLVTLATVSLLDAAIDRWPFAFMGHGPLVANLIYAGIVLLVPLYDLAVVRKFQRVTLLAVAFVLVLHFAEIPLGMTPAWHHFAAFMERL